MRRKERNRSVTFHSMDKSEMSGPSVFLGGSCNPTVWRKEVAVPALEAAGVTFYNPQVDAWSEELAVEALAKANAAVLLFVIDDKTRAIASMMEATEYICSGRRVVLVVKDCAAGSFSAGGLKDLNRARSYLRDLAQRHSTPVCASVAEACAVAAKLANSS